jgi:hypothetical protein
LGQATVAALAALGQAVAGAFTAIPGLLNDAITGAIPDVVGSAED